MIQGVVRQQHDCSMQTCREIPTATEGRRQHSQSPWLSYQSWVLILCKSHPARCVKIPANTLKSFSSLSRPVWETPSAIQRDTQAQTENTPGRGAVSREEGCWSRHTLLLLPSPSLSFRFYQRHSVWKGTCFLQKKKKKKKQAKEGLLWLTKKPEEPQNFILLEKFHCWQNN